MCREGEGEGGGGASGGDGSDVMGDAGRQRARVHDDDGGRAAPRYDTRY